MRARVGSEEIDVGVRPGELVEGALGEVLDDVVSVGGKGKTLGVRDLVGDVVPVGGPTDFERLALGVGGPGRHGSDLSAAARIRAPVDQGVARQLEVAAHRECGRRIPEQELRVACRDGELSMRGAKTRGVAGRPPDRSDAALGGRRTPRPSGGHADSETADAHPCRGDGHELAPVERGGHRIGERARQSAADRGVLESPDCALDARLGEEAGLGRQQLVGGDGGLGRGERGEAHDEHGEHEKDQHGHRQGRAALVGGESADVLQRRPVMRDSA